MNLLLAGANFRSAPLEIREQLAIPPRELPTALSSFQTEFGIREAVILSTCNRIEVYASSPNSTETFGRLSDFLSARSRLAPETIRPHLYRLTDREVIEHLFRVTAGLDSMVLGESEITAQVKQAYYFAQVQGLTGPLLNRLFQKALHAAKALRSHTRIAFGQASIGSLVVSLARQLFGEQLRHREVLLWGAGKAAESTARHLIKSGVGQLWIVNRTPLKAQDLATLCQSGWLSWEQALTHLAHVDIAIVCTQAPHYVIDQADRDLVARQRGSRPLFLVDLAVPRNVDPALKDHPSVHLYDVDDLQTVAHVVVARRQQEVGRCDALIGQQVAHFMQWWQRPSDKEVSPCQSVESLASV